MPGFIPPSSTPAFVSPSPLQSSLPLSSPCALPPSRRAHTSNRTPKLLRVIRRRRTLPLVACDKPTPSPQPSQPPPDQLLQTPCVIGNYCLEEGATERQGPFLYFDAEFASDSPLRSEVAPFGLTVKLLSLRGLTDWRALDSIKLEAAVQSAVHHPAVPYFVDFFEHETDTDYLYLLVTARAPGSSLHAFTAKHRVSPRFVRAVTARLLSTLADLAALSPPVSPGAISPHTVFIHPTPVTTPRSSDVPQTPDSVTEDLQTDPSPLVMLTSVASTPALSRASSRFIAPECFSAPTYGGDADTDSEDGEQDDGLGSTHVATGRADLYAAGATLHFLVTGKPPSPNRIDNKELSFTPGLRAADPQLVAVLEDLISVNVDDRPVSAAAALAKLHGEVIEDEDDRMSADGDDERELDPYFMRADLPSVDLINTPFAGPTLRSGGLRTRPAALSSKRRRRRRRRPRDASLNRVHVQVSAQGRRLRVAGTPLGFTGGTFGRLAYATMWTSFVAIWTGGVVASGGLGYAMALFSVPFWRVSAGMVRGLASEVRGGGELRLCAGDDELLRRKVRRRVGEPAQDPGLQAEVETGGLDTVHVGTMGTHTCERSDAGGVATLTVQRIVGSRIELRGGLECVGGASVTDKDVMESDGGFAVEVLWEGRRVRLVSGVPWSQANRACDAINEFLTMHAPRRPLRRDEIEVMESEAESEAESSDSWELWNS